MKKNMYSTALMVAIVTALSFGAVGEVNALSKKVEEGQEIGFDKESLDREIQQFNNSEKSQHTYTIDNITSVDCENQLYTISGIRYQVFAADIEDIYSDEGLKNSLQKLYNDGEKVYIFGGIGTNEFMELLEVDDLKAYCENENGQRFEEDVDITSTPGGSDRVSIIGANNEGQIHIIDITGLSELSTEIAIANIIDKEESLIAELQRGTETVKSSSKDLTAVVYTVNDVLVGKSFCRWVLFQDSADRDVEYDYFAVRPVVWATAYNNYKVFESEVTINTSKNHFLQDYQPSSTKYSDFSVSLDLISGSVTASGTIPVGGYISSSADWSNNEVKWSLIGDGEIKPVFSWRSPANNRQASVDVQFLSGFTRTNGGEYKDASYSFGISYSY